MPFSAGMSGSGVLSFTSGRRGVVLRNDICSRVQLQKTKEANHEKLEWGLVLLLRTRHHTFSGPQNNVLIGWSPDGRKTQLIIVPTLFELKELLK